MHFRFLFQKDNDEWLSPSCRPQDKHCLQLLIFQICNTQSFWNQGHLKGLIFNFIYREAHTVQSHAALLPNVGLKVCWKLNPKLPRITELFEAFHFPMVSTCPDTIWPCIRSLALNERSRFTTELSDKTDFPNW